MKEWELHVVYKNKGRKMKAVLEYESKQVLRIRVFGASKSIVLQTDYPLRNSKTPKGARNVQWKLIDGSFGFGDADTSALLYNITKELESKLKESFPPNSLLF